MPEKVGEQAAAVFRAAYVLNADAVEWLLSSMVDKDEDEEVEEDEKGEGAQQVELTHWEKVDEWGLDRRGELRLLWQRVKEERRRARQRARQESQGAQPSHQRVRQLLVELRALPVVPLDEEKT